MKTRITHLIFPLLLAFSGVLSAGDTHSAPGIPVRPDPARAEKVKIMESFFTKRGMAPAEARRQALEAVAAQELREQLQAEGKITVRRVKPGEPAAPAAGSTAPVSAAAATRGGDSFYQSVATSSRPVDLVVVRKSMHQMELIKNRKILRKYFVALGKTPKGHKQHRGDNRTPEGNYILDYKKASSEYSLSIHISYPNDDDRQKARSRGLDPGGMIMIHGQPNRIGRSADEDQDGELNVNKFLQPSNWTNGCIALLNNDMDEVYQMIVPGTPITILP